MPIAHLHGGRSLLLFVILPFGRLRAGCVSHVMASLSNHDKLMTGLASGIYKQPVDEGNGKRQGNPMKKSLVILAILLFFPAVHAMASQKAESGKINPDRDKPITITSDRMEAFNMQRMVVFSGNAVAVQGDKVIKADSILLYYKKDPADAGGSGKKAESGELGQAGSVEKIEAKGNVRITQEKKIVTGEYAVYYQDSQKIVMTGNAVMREEKNVIRGDRVDVFLDENRGVVESSGDKRVTATIYPAEKKDKK
jgi:lipopolysaccharide export system protein LptA